MINIDMSLFIQIANFVVLICVLNVILYKPIRKIVSQRNEKIKGLEQGIDTFKRDSREKEEAFSSGIKAARARGLKEKETLLTAASEQERRIIEEVNRKAQADLDELREKIAKDTQSVRTSLQQEIDAFADAIGEKILGRTVS